MTNTVVLTLPEFGLPFPPGGEPQTSSRFASWYARERHCLKAWKAISALSGLLTPLLLFLIAEMWREEDGEHLFSREPNGQQELSPSVHALGANTAASPKRGRKYRNGRTRGKLWGEWRKSVLTTSQTVHAASISHSSVCSFLIVKAPTYLRSFLEQVSLIPLSWVSVEPFTCTRIQNSPIKLCILKSFTDCQMWNKDCLKFCPCSPEFPLVSYNSKVSPLIKSLGTDQKQIFNRLSPDLGNSSW